MTLRFLPVGPRTLLVELPDLDATLALFDALAAAPLPGIAEVIPAARTLMVRSAPKRLADGRLAAAIATRVRRRPGKRLTIGKPIVMGRRTFEAIGRVLPHRHNIVVTRDHSYVAEGCTIADSAEGALSA